MESEAAWCGRNAESEVGLEALIAACARDEEALNPTIKTVNVS